MWKNIIKAVSLTVLAMASAAAHAHDDVRFSVSFGNATPVYAAPVVYSAPVVYAAPVTYREPVVVYSSNRWGVTPINAYQAPQRVVVYPAPVSYVDDGYSVRQRCHSRGHGRHHWD